MRTLSLVTIAVVATLGLGPGGAGAARAQGAAAATPQRARLDSVPREYLPPAGMCRIWIDGVPAAQQPAPTDCPTAVQRKPANGRVVYGEAPKQGGKAPASSRIPVKGFTAPGQASRPPVPPELPDQARADQRPPREAWESKRITDDQLFGDRPGSLPAGSSPGMPVGAMPPGSMPPGTTALLGSYQGYVGPGGVVVGAGPINDPRYFTPNPGATPPGFGSAACLDRDGDGWCDDSRFGPPACLDQDRDGRCDDLPAFASQAYPQVLPPMRAALDVITGRGSVEVMQWLGTNEFIVRVPDQGRGGIPWRAIFLDGNNELLQIWTDRDRDGRADRVEVFRNGQRVKLIQR
jgi:hypothetical protein